MLRFLRDTRRNELSSNTSRNYLLYAIGEIFLVVVGILIALQVNNWNEKRLLLEQKNSILTEILQDLAIDTTSIDFLRADVIQKDLNTKYLMDYLLGNTNEFDEDRLTDAFFRANNLLDFTPIKTSYDLLVETGAINKIETPGLKEGLIDYYELDIFEQQVLEQKSTYSSNYGNIRFENMPIGILREELKDRLGVGELAPSIISNESFDWEGLKGDEEFLTALDKILMITLVFHYDYNRYEQAQMLLLGLVREELAN